MTATIPARSRTLPVAIPIEGAYLMGELTIPPAAHGIVVFAHGSGSSHRSPRNRMVADRFHNAGLGTLLFDMLTEREAAWDETSRRLRFDVDLMAARLLGAAEWLIAQPAARGLPVGYFGASTGAAAAMLAAAWQPGLVCAIVSRGGRPDLAGESLDVIQTPTLLIVGAQDTRVVEFNEEALRRLPARAKDLVIVPGASHLFEEPGTMAEVAYLASIWFARHMHRIPALH
jgi:putative phosphoribosyl transferase